MNRILVALLAVTGLFLFGAHRAYSGEVEKEEGSTELAAAARVPALNQKLVAYAKSKLGQTVGDGECATLVNAGYQEIGARRDPPFGPGVDYIWGTEIKDPKKVLPGDVIQFRDAVFQSRKRKKNGTITISTFRLPHHTAIVSEVRTPGTVFVVLNQNAGDSTMSDATDRTVKNTLIKMASLKSGKLWFFRPIAK
jgi:hypothetical protein